MNRKKILVFCVGIMSILFMSVVFAATTIGLTEDKNYAVDVIDDGSNTTTSDENIQVQTKVVDQQNTEITLETSAKNLIERKDKEVAIVVDSSYSMTTNSEGYNIKETAINIVNKIFEEVSKVKVAVVDNTGTKVGLTTSNNAVTPTNVTDAINNISNNNGNSISDGLNAAKRLFTAGDSVEKYVIVITDATDDAKAELESLSTDGIKVYSILVDITSTAFGNTSAPVPQDGTVYMLSDFDEQNLVDDINKTIKNINICNTFNEEILKSSSRGNFTLEIVSNETDGTAIQNNDGSLSWNIDTLKSGENKKVKYKLKLNTSSTIGTDSLYNDIKVIKDMTVKYLPCNVTAEKQLNATNINPTIQICDAYSLQINAVGKDTTIPVENVVFDITGVDESGNTVIKETGLVSDSKGNVTIETIKQLGKINYTITPHVNNLIGYEATNPVGLIVNNEYTATGGNLITSYFDSNKASTDDSNGKRSVTVEVPIELQKFKFVLNVADLSDPTSKLPGIDFRLIQPKLNNKYEMDALYGTTNNNGQIEFDASIMSVAGTYEYILSQTSDKVGYENIGNATIRVTFDDQGKVVDNGVQVLFNSNVDGYKVSDDEVHINVQEKCNSSNTFNVKMNLKDEETNAPIEGAIYTFTVTKVSGTSNDTLTYTKVTDSNGEIDFKSIAAESGYTKIVVHEDTPNNAYKAASADKEIIINRQGGIIYEINLGGDYTTKDQNNNNGIIVNLTSKKKDELNIVRIHLTQKDDTVMNLLNIPMELKDVTSGRVYNATTNSDGFAEFTLDDPSTITDGTYYFEVRTIYLPTGYVEPDVKATVKVSVQNGVVTDITDVTTSGQDMPIMNPTILNENKDTTISNIAYADYALTADVNSTSCLKIKLLDADNGTPVANGKYQITMEKDGGQIANAGSTGKYTNTDGYTNKMTIPGLDSNPVTITIAQVYDETRQNGYKVDSKIYTIVVHKEADGTLQVDRFTLNDGSEVPAGMECTFEDLNDDKIFETLVFNHINTIINPGDVILDLTVLKTDYVTGFPDQSQELIVWSDDFEIYDESIGSYENFDKNNPYNPFTTGIISSNQSKGQINVRLKPKNLPEVEDMNRDGYPTGGAVLNIGEWNAETGKAIPGTEYQIQINFTYSKETGTYKYSGYSNLTNWSLLKEFHHSTSQNSGEGYIESATLELWSNYGETANFAMDFSKYNYLGDELVGAKYNVKVALPTGKFISLTQNIINGDDSIEIPELYVKEGSIITISEVEAPIGYEVDTQDASFRIDSIDAGTGVATLSEYGVKNSRIQLDGNNIVTDRNGNFKFIQKVKLTDLEMNNTKFGIISKDKEKNTPTKGNSYKIVTNTGSSAVSKTTDEYGYVRTLIGGEKKRDYMEYTISQNLADSTEVTQYYKRLADDIHVKVYFDDNGNIDNDPTSPNYYGTLCSSVDPNYGVTWYIDSVNSDDRISVVILQEKEDPLNINFKTVDAFTGATIINTATYKVTPSWELSGEGELSTQVGYVEPNKAVTYNLESTINENYVSIAQQQFTVEYDADGNVSDVTVAPNSTHLSATKNSNDSQTVDLTITIEPAVPFAIHTTDYYTGASLQNATFEVERADGVLSVNKATNSDGNAVCFSGDFGTGSSNGNQEVLYIVRQTSATHTYATVEEFRIKVEFNSNREIVGASLYGDTDSTNKFITVSYTQPSTSGNVGYNGNDKGIVNIEVKNYPAFNIEFTNVDRINNSIKLPGTKFQMTSSVLKYPLTSTEQITSETNGTDINGIEIGYVDRTTFGKTETYEIKNTVASNGYQIIRSSIKLEVDFDSNGYVNIANGNPVRVIEGNDYVDVSLYNPATTNAENFGIKLTIKSSPIFRINIDNIDRKDYNNGITTNLAGAEYSITSDYNTSADVVKASTDTLIAMLAETPINDSVVYTIKETKPAVNYQTIERDIIMTVHFDINGCIDNVSLDAKNTPYVTANKLANIVNTEDNFTIDLTIRNNPLIALNLNKINENGDTLNNVKFHIEGKEKGTDEFMFSQDVTTISGLGAFRIDRALDGKTIVYTISETKNTAGYEYIPSDLSMEITYDSEGRIAKDSNSQYLVQLTPQVNWATINATNDYGIDINVINERIKDIGINLNTIDKYDDSKRAEHAEIKAYFTENNATFKEDEEHSTTLITSRDDDNDGTPDFGYGNDYQTLGKAENIAKEEIEGMQTATLVLKEIKTPNAYYDTNSNVSKDNIYMSWSYYNLSSARIDLTFTDEGKIATATLRTNNLGTTPLGKQLDERYIDVTIDKTNPYMLNIDLKYYPMLEMTINAVSDDTYSRAVDNNDNELIGTYRVGPQHYNDYVSIYHDYNTNLRNGLVTAGYIGGAQLGGLVPNPQTKDSKILNENTNIYEANNYGLWVGEQSDVTNSVDVNNGGRIRYVYISEPNNEAKSEPDNNYSGYEQLKYQQHGQQDRSPMYMSYNNALIGAIQVTYSEKGEIIDAKILEDKEADSDNRKEQNDNSKYITVEISDNKHGIIVKVQYKRTTTIEAKVTDNVTGAELKNITLSPFKGGVINTNRNYTYDPSGLRNLASGENTWTYWGGNDANGDRRYVIGTKFNNSTMYNGYETIGDIQLDIHYDEYGYVDINKSKVLSTNPNGDPNAVIERVDKDKIYLNIIANRKFDIQIDKKDKFDRSKDLSSARFTIKSTKTDIKASDGSSVNTKTGIQPGKRTQVGLIHKSETVTYTISETFTPEGYATIDNFDMDVVFDENGVISKIILEDGTVLYDILGAHTSTKIPIKLVSVAERYKTTKPQNITDLRFELYNSPKFDTNITVKDKFYTNETIEGVTFEITNDTYGISATGNLITNEKGKIETYVGGVYPKETVTYTIKQTSTPSGYKSKKSDIKVDVTYDDNGYVTNYVVTKGNDDESNISLDTKKRGLNIIVYNEPKDVRIGIEKYDDLTKGKLENVEFKVTRQEVASSNTTEFNGQTEVNGNITETVDSFNTAKEVVYTISETKQLEAYRAIEDVVIRVKYGDDGRIVYSNVDSNPSNVKVEIPTAGNMKTLANGDKVHMKISIPNDDTYDLIVRNEAKDISNLGVKDTLYNIFINGNELKDPDYPEIEKTTNSSGYVYIRNRKESGDININVSEAQIGEGFRQNVSNSADLTFTKGVATYSLDLDISKLAAKGYSLISGPDDIYDTNYKNGKQYVIELNSSDNTQVIVNVFEDTGKIVMIFKNETMSNLNLRKIDATTGDRLKGTEFEIEAQEVDTFGNLQGTPTIITSSSVTNENGLIYIDLGRRPQNKKIKYTFKEITPPSGYTSIGTTAITCTYDAKGEISEKESSSKRIGADGSEYDLNISIKNGDLNTYSVKVISIDSRKGSTATGQSNNRINGSTFDVTVTDSKGLKLAEVKNEATDEGKDTFGYPENGIITLDGLQAEGTISVEVNQTGVVDGFIRGDNQTTGTLTFENNYTNIGGEPEVSLSNLNDSGFIDSYIDQNENQIVIKVYNDPQVKLNLHKENIDTGTPLEGVTFNITSEIDGQNRVATVPTTLDVDTQGTDSEGNETVVIGAPEYGKTVIYTIKENKIPDYEQLDDIKIKVTYNTEGKINDWEVLSDESYAQVKESVLKIGDTYSWKTYTKDEMEDLKDECKDKNIPLTTEYTKGTRQLNTLIKNMESEKIIPYTIVVEVQDELRMPVSGIGIDLKLTQGVGNNPIFPNKETDLNGQVSYTADGSDRIEIDIDITEGKSYSFNQDLNCILYKNSKTGEISPTQNNNVLPEVDNVNHVIKLLILSEIKDDRYSIALMKMDKASNSTIINNPATFSITREENITDGTIEQTIADKEQTNTNSILNLSNLEMPADVGTYTYKIYEEESPTGYNKLDDSVNVDITFDLDNLGNKVITNIVSSDEDKIYVAKTSKQGMVLCVNNIETVPDDQYMLNIFKVDEKTGDKLDGAIFKVKIPNSNDTSVYTESGENTTNKGQLDYCYVEQDKDYETRLKQMKRPTVDEVKAEENGILTHTYTFQEATAPEGYALDRTEINLSIDFEVATDNDGNEFVRIKDAVSDHTDIMEVKDIQDDQIMAEIYNKEQASSYTVHYDANTSDSTTNMPSDQIKLAGAPLTIDANIPTRDGYKFKEWNTAVDGTGTSFQSGGTYAIDADVTLYAIWEVAQYTVHYEANAPIDANTGVAIGLVIDMPTDQAKTHGVDITLDDDGVTPTIPNVTNYYEFAGWNSEADGTGTHYDAGDLYNIDADINLYAEWNYIIRYNANVPVDTNGLPMGTANDIPTEQHEKVNSQTDAIIDDLSIYTNAPTMDGYKFKEWNTEADGTGTTYNPNDTYAERKGMDLYAIWEYEITYEENKPLDENGLVANVTINNMPSSPQTVMANTTAVIANSKDNPNVPTTNPDDYVFVEWNTKPDGSGDSYKQDDVYNGNISVTLYAIWENSGNLYLKSLNDEYMITDAMVDDSKNRVTVTYNTKDEEEYNEGDKYLLGILPQTSRRTSKEEHEGTTLIEFKKYLDTNGEIKVYKDVDKNDILDTMTDTEIADTDLVGTGMFLHITKGTQEITLRVVVRGDCNGDGMAISNDATIANKYIGSLQRTIVTSEYYKLAFDADLNGRIIAADNTMITNMVSMRCKYAYRPSITITLDTQGGTIVPSIATSTITSNFLVYEGATYETEKNYGTLPLAKKDGYTFIGWFDDNGNQVTGTTKVTNTSPHTLHARYK